MMRSNLSRLGRIVLSAAITGALGFGAVQAFAGPAAAQNPGYCGHDTCSARCQNSGYGFGRCMDWQCYCYSAGTWVPAP